ncbi:MAG: YecA family protein [Methylohalobius crimeensis]
MTDHPKNDFHATLEAILTVSGHPYPASEIHGAWTGLLSGRPDISFEEASRRLAEILPVQDEKAFSVLREVFTLIRQALNDEHFGFALWLPDEDVPLQERAAALAYWCQGFLYGLGVSGGSPDSSQVEEILRDFREIAQLDASLENDDEEEEEEAWMELVEFVRVGAQLIYTEAHLQQAWEKSDGE